MLLAKLLKHGAQGKKARRKMPEMHLWLKNLACYDGTPNGQEEPKHAKKR